MVEETKINEWELRNEANKRKKAEEIENLAFKAGEASGKVKYTKYPKKSISSFDRFLKPVKTRYLPKPTVGTQQLSAGQRMLNDLFNGQPTFGTGNNLPIINHTLNSGNGLIKTGDFERRTGRMFGLR